MCYKMHPKKERKGEKKKKEGRKGDSPTQMIYFQREAGRKGWKN